ncbi:MAG: hypothetical protein MHM6MM_007127 [Cercozoa sp. M6MM]
MFMRHAVSRARNVRLRSTFERDLDKVIVDRLYRTRNVHPVAAAAFGMISILGVFLCRWQLERRQWKIGVIGQMERQLRERPQKLPFGSIFKDTERVGSSKDELVAPFFDIHKLRQRRWKVTGRFDYSHQVLVGPRSTPVRKQAGSDKARQRDDNIMSSGDKQRPGYLVLTPFFRADVPPEAPLNERRLWVLRGWAPMPGDTLHHAPSNVLDALAMSTHENSDEGAQEIIVSARGCDKQLMLTQARKAQKTEVHTLMPMISAKEMQHFVSTETKKATSARIPDPEDIILFEMIDDNPESHPIALVRRGASQLQKVAIDPAKHAAYAITWGSMAVVGAAVALSLAFPGRMQRALLPMMPLTTKSGYVRRHFPAEFRRLAKSHGEPI